MLAMTFAAAVAPQNHAAEPSRVIGAAAPGVSGEAVVDIERSGGPAFVSASASGDCKMAGRKCRSQFCMGDYLFATAVDAPAAPRRVSAGPERAAGRIGTRPGLSPPPPKYLLS